MTNQTFVTSEDSPKQVARKKLTDSKLKRAFLWIMAGLLVFFLLYAAIVAKAEPTQADHLRNANEYRQEMYKLGELLGKEKLQLTAETCKKEKEAGRPENCDLVF